MRPVRPSLFLAAAIILTGCAAGSGPAAAPPPAAQGGGAAAAPAPSAPAGAGTVSYTAAQAQRGQQVFSTICSACHALSEFRGQLFQTTWRSRPLGDFYQFISTAMPQDNPGGLRPEQYAAVVAHVLQLNGVPPGTSEIPADGRALQGVPWPR